MTITLFNREIQLKTHNCSFFNQPSTKLDSPYINLYVRTDGCNANCRFCTYMSSKKWNVKKYREILSELKSKIEIRKIGVTGGEPTLDWDSFLEISSIGREFVPNCELSLNTNGYNLSKLVDDPIYQEYDTINISRHHYNDDINNDIFMTKTPTSEELRILSDNESDTHKIQLRCNLINGYIDTKEEIFKYLNWSNDIGINDVGLISLMPNNDYSKENFINFNIRELIGDDFYLTKKSERYGGGCECFNYVFTPENNFRRPIRVYQKNTFRPSEISETLVYDGENLTIGFSNDIIY